jgi:hypothetical protein
MDDKKDEEKELSFKTIIPYLGSFIIFLGVVRLMFYYWQFNIQIISYLEFSEIATSFLDMLLFSIFIGIATIITLFFQANRNNNQNGNITFTQISNTESFWQRLKYYPYYIRLIPYCIIMIGLSIILKLIFKTFTWNEILIFCAFCLTTNVVLIVLVEALIKHQKLGSTKNQWFLIGLVSLFTGCLIITIVKTFTEVNDVRERKAYYGTTIVLDDSTKLVSDSTNYFISKTQNFVFFYHEKTKTSDVYPMTRVKQLSFKVNGK